ncbi:hypothetical protein AXG93_2458s1000 [Marchantia polymorpha subsp. ruderalis]|uniref:JmjC domain-containing protein n=1 Tax=Marchantia polymorpha subsp. ruderalis TaxID=1480154 RepID=A0A176VFU4_MARPO|nr:hypothetical protein AXG93_2458s1000 [Marchantia polymorpha subsp. ruderalis]
MGLVRYMPDEVPGVTSLMIYIGMIFSWFAWHVEYHELHSLNYLHTEASKTRLVQNAGEYVVTFPPAITWDSDAGLIAEQLQTLLLLVGCMSLRRSGTECGNELPSYAFTSVDGDELDGVAASAKQ